MNIEARTSKEGLDKLRIYTPYFLKYVAGLPNLSLNFSSSFLLGTPS
jgi:hypothetical protein